MRNIATITKDIAIQNSRSVDKYFKDMAIQAAQSWRRGRSQLSYDGCNAFMDPQR